MSDQPPDDRGVDGADPSTADREPPRPVALTADDPLAAEYSLGVGGPIGTHAGRHPWWTPVRVVLALTALCCALGLVSKTPCYQTSWGSDEVRYSDLCYSDLPYLYVGRGFAELEWPYSDAIASATATTSWSTPSGSPTTPGPRRT